MDGADRRGEAGLGAQRIAAGDEGEIVGAAAQLVDEIGDQIVEPAGFADQAGRALRVEQDGRRRRWRLRRAASIRASGRRAAGRQARRRGFRRRSRWRRRAAAVIGRTAGTSGRPGKFAGGAEQDEPIEQAAGGAAGHRRVAGGFGGRDAILGEQEVDDFLGRFRAQFGRDGDQGVRAAAKIGGEVEGGGGGERDRACGGIWPGGLARPWPSGCARRSQGRIQDFRQRSAARAAASAVGSRGRISNTQSARISDGVAGASGRVENARAAALAAAETGSPSPAQAFRLAAEAVRGSTARSSRAAVSRIRPGSRLGGRPAPSRQSDRRFAAGPSGSPTAKRRSRSAASSALRRRILAEAAALCSASRERNAPAAGGSARR